MRLPGTPVLLAAGIIWVACAASINENEQHQNIARKVSESLMMAGGSHITHSFITQPVF
jgi:hypothetical protein